MKHCTTKSIMAYCQGILPEGKRLSVAAHLEECSRCAKMLKAVEFALRGPSVPAEQPAPSDAVLARILSYHAKASEKKGAIRFIIEDRIRKFHGLHFAAAGIAVVMLALTVFFAVSPIETGMRIKALRVSGIVKSGKNVVTKGHSLKPGSRVETGEGSKIAMSAGDMMKIRAGEQTALLIRSAHLQKNTGKAVFDVLMEKGTVSAQFDQTKNLEYRLQTPHATITSKGSQIVVKVDDSGTQLVMKSGSAVILSNAGSNITAEEGDGYTIKGALSMNNPEEQDDITYSDSLSLPENDDIMD